MASRTILSAASDFSSTSLCLAGKRRKQDTFLKKDCINIFHFRFLLKLIDT